jgi:hypothetical protein
MFALKLGPREEPVALINRAQDIATQLKNLKEDIRESQISSAVVAALEASPLYESTIKTMQTMGGVITINRLINAFQNTGVPKIAGALHVEHDNEVPQPQQSYLNESIANLSKVANQIKNHVHKRFAPYFKKNHHGRGGQDAQQQDGQHGGRGQGGGYRGNRGGYQNNRGGYNPRGGYQGGNNNTKATGVVTKATGVAQEAVVVCPFPVVVADKVPLGATIVAKKTIQVMIVSCHVVLVATDTTSSMIVTLTPCPTTTPGTKGNTPVPTKQLTHPLSVRTSRRPTLGKHSIPTIHCPRTFHGMVHLAMSRVKWKSQPTPTRTFTT